MQTAVGAELSDTENPQSAISNQQSGMPTVPADCPFLDVGHLHYILRRPWVFPVHLPDLIRIVRFDDDQGAGPILERPAKDDHSGLEQRVHIARVFVPERLFTRGLVRIPERAGLQKRSIVCRVRRHFAPQSETALLLTSSPAKRYRVMAGDSRSVAW